MVTFRFMPKPPKGKRIATLGVGGGVSVLATDECHTVGFVMPPLDEAVKRDLTRNVTSDAGIMLGNPIDFPFWTMGEEQYRDALRTLLKWDGIDLFLLLAPLRQSEPEMADYVPFAEYQLNNFIKVAAECDKPTAVVINFLATGQSWLAAAGLQQKCYEAGLTTYHSTASALKAIGRLIRYRETM